MIIDIDKRNGKKNEQNSITLKIFRKIISLMPKYEIIHYTDDDKALLAPFLFVTVNLSWRIFFFHFPKILKNIENYMFFSVTSAFIRCF